MCFDFLFPKALITSPSADKERLMFCASLSRSPVASVLLILSEPAKSIKFNDDESLPIVYLFKLNDSNSYHNVKFLEKEDNDKSTMFNDLNKIDDLLISIPSNSTKEQLDKTTDESDEVKTSSTTSNILHHLIRPTDPFCKNA